MDEKLKELGLLLNKVSQEKLSVVTRDLRFDWSDPTKLKPGQLDVLIKRLRAATRKNLLDMEAEAKKSKTIQAMQRSLAKLHMHIKEGK